MQEKKYPFSVRPLGFPGPQLIQLAELLGQAPPSGPAYFCLPDDSLQEPDLYIANGDDLKALATLSALNPGELQPALILGSPAVQFPFPQLAKPAAPGPLFAALEHLIEQRAEALALITARGLPFVPERRRRERLDVDLTDPSEYVARRRTPARGAVLIIDKGGAFRDHVAKLLGARKLAIEWTDSAVTAARLCEETPVAVVLVNTSTPGIDPYALCSQIKAHDNGLRVAVVLMVSPAFPYDAARARASGVRGLLDKPIADRHLVGALKKLLSLPT